MPKKGRFRLYQVKGRDCKGRSTRRIKKIENNDGRNNSKIQRIGTNQNVKECKRDPLSFGEWKPEIFSRTCSYIPPLYKCDAKFRVDLQNHVAVVHEKPKILDESLRKAQKSKIRLDSRKGINSRGQPTRSNTYRTAVQVAPRLDSSVGNIESSAEVINLHPQPYAADQTVVKSERDPLNLEDPKTEFSCTSSILQLYRYKCQSCNFDAELEVDLHNHVTVAHKKRKILIEGLRKYCCKNCKFQTWSLLVLKKHVRTCPDLSVTEWLNCELCSNRTTFEMILKCEQCSGGPSEDFTHNTEGFE